MKNDRRNFVKKIGISKFAKEKSIFFSFINGEEVMHLSDHMPDIKKIISVMVEPEIMSQKCVNTIRGQSAEGAYLSGKKIVVHMKLKQKILYVADVTEKTIHIIENECFQSAYIVIPPYIEGSQVEELLEFEYLKTSIHVQNIGIRKISSRSILKNVSLHIDTFLIPTYELSYALHEEYGNSNVFISYGNGRHKKQLTFSRIHHYIRPVWSPNGWQIAFLSDQENIKGTYMMYMYSMSDGTTKKITYKNQFDTISSFCWDGHGQKIIFSAVINKEKQLFCIDVNTLEYKQLTFGSSEIKNFKPKMNQAGEKVGFLQSISGVSNLCILDVHTLSITKLTSSGSIKDFDWSKDGKFITYVFQRIGECSKICTIDLETKEVSLLKIPSYIITIRNICYSPNNRYISFIGSNLETDNIFCYDLWENEMVNLTKNFRNIKISDFVWKIDTRSIYYAANDLGYYNIYRISLKDRSIYSIISTISSKIELSYRPKII